MKTKTIAIPCELIKALSFVGRSSIIVRFENDRNVSCLIEDGEVIVTEEIFDDETDDKSNVECADNCDEEIEVSETCSDCPHFCPACGECTKDTYLR